MNTDKQNPEYNITTELVRAISTVHNLIHDIENQIYKGQIVPPSPHAFDGDLFEYCEYTRARFLKDYLDELELPKPPTRASKTKTDKNP